MNSEHLNLPNLQPWHTSMENQQETQCLHDHRILDILVSWRSFLISSIQASCFVTRLIYKDFVAYTSLIQTSLLGILGVKSENVVHECHGCGRLRCCKHVVRSCFTYVPRSNPGIYMCIRLGGWSIQTTTGKLVWMAHPTIPCNLTMFCISPRPSNVKVELRIWGNAKFST